MTPHQTSLRRRHHQDDAPLPTKIGRKRLADVSVYMRLRHHVKVWTTTKGSKTALARLLGPEKYPSLINRVLKQQPIMLANAEAIARVLGYRLTLVKRDSPSR